MNSDLFAKVVTEPPKTLEHLPATADYPIPVESRDPSLDSTLVHEATGRVSDWPDMAGRYRIQSEIARGGMGVVLRAVDLDIERTLAVKLMLPAAQRMPHGEQRFLEEAKITGQLQHPGIPPVHEIGRLDDGRPFFAMKLIEGQTLARLLRNGQESRVRDLPRFLGIFGQICQTLAYAHSRGILHRDLKPSNVMVGAFGEVQVMDWGLAKRRQAAECGSPTEQANPKSEISNPKSEISIPQSDMTQAGAALGTLGYMAPEQARGEVDRLDERSDVFGLGAILCVVLTGEPAYRGKDANDLWQQAQAGNVSDAFARLDACGADWELVALAKQCLAPHREDRPGNAGDVAGAVSAYQARVQEKLRQAELERAAAQTRAAEERKRRWLQGWLGAAGVVLVAVVAGGLVYNQREESRFATEAAQRKNKEDVRIAGIERDAAHELQEAQELREEALLSMQQPDRWQSRLALAVSKVRTVEADLAREKASGDQSLKDQLEQLRSMLEADEQDRQLVLQLRRLQQHTGVGFNKQLNILGFFEVVPKYRAAFARLEIVPLRTPVARAAQLIQQRPGQVRDALIASLDDWIHLDLNSKSPEQQWLKDVVAQADQDPWRASVIAALNSADGAVVDELLASPAFALQPSITLMILGLHLHGRGQSDLALRVLRRTHEMHPDHFGTTIVLASILSSLETGHEEIIRLMSIARSLNPKEPAVHNRLGLAHYYANDLDKAAAAYRKAIELDDTCAPSHNNLGLTLQKQKKLPEAIQAFRESLHHDPEFATALYNLAMALQENSELDEAKPCYRRAIQLAEDTVRREDAYRQITEFEAGQQPVNEALALMHNNFGSLHFIQGNRPEAIVEFRKAVELDAGNSGAVSNLAAALSGTGNDADEAIHLARRALELDPTQAKAYNSLAYALFTQKNYAESLDHYQQALKLEPNYDDAWWNLGLLLEDQKDDEGAVDAYLRFLELRPRDDEAQQSLTTLLRRLMFRGQDVAARYQRTLQVASPDAQLWSDYGFALKQTKNVSGAVAVYKQALQIDRKHARTHNRLGAVMREQRKWDEAVAAFKQAAELQPSDAQFWCDLGAALVEARRPLEAIANLQQAVKVDPKYPFSHGSLARVWLEEGELERAKLGTTRCLELMEEGKFAPQHPAWAAYRQQLSTIEKFLTFDQRLPNLLAGNERPNDAQERIELASFCQNYKQRYLAAAQFYDEAFQENPSTADNLAKGIRPSAARAALLAAAGEGKDADQLTDSERGAWRKKSLDWMRADLSAWRNTTKAAGGNEKALLQSRLQEWQQHLDFANVKDAKRLAGLPTEEQQDWQKFWADVELLLAQSAAR